MTSARLELKKEEALAAPRPLTEEMKARVGEARRAQIRSEIEAEITARLDREAEESYRAELKKEVETECDPAKALYSIDISLPPECPYLLTNGKIIHYPEKTYSVPLDVYHDLRSRMWLAWRNEEQRLNDKTANEYRRKKHSMLKLGARP